MLAINFASGYSQTNEFGQSVIYQVLYRLVLLYQRGGLVCGTVLNGTNQHQLRRRSLLRFFYASGR